MVATYTCNHCPSMYIYDHLAGGSGVLSGLRAVAWDDDILNDLAPIHPMPDCYLYDEIELH